MNLRLLVNLTLTAIVTIVFNPLIVAAKTPIKELQNNRGITISGRVTSIVGNDFILRDSTGEVIVDAGPRWWHQIDLNPNETVTVVGEMDEGEFDAFSTIRANGETIQIRDYLSKTARYIIENCLRLDIGTLVVGINKGWKQDINIGKRINQNFVQIPFYSLKEKLKSLCKTYGIQYVEQEESYTSKASALDNDDIPIYNPNNTVKYTFSGKRIKRGLYLSKDNIRINADCNGAWNIGRKSKHEGFSQVSSGLLTSPLRISDLNVSLS
jgi:IS605 OrfB family transposase